MKKNNRPMGFIIVLFATASIGVSTAAYAVNDWVTGNVYSMDEYSAYAAGQYGIMVTLSNKAWFNAATAASNASACYGPFRIVAGMQNVDEEAKKRFFSLLLSAYHAGSPVRLYVDPSTGPYCVVQIAAIGAA